MTEDAGGRWRKAMSERLKRLSCLCRVCWDFGRELQASWSKDQGPFLSAAMAYYAVLSLVPLLIIIVTAAQLVLGPEAAEAALADQLESVLGANTTAAVIGLIDQAAADSARLLATALGAVMLIYGASGVFGRLRGAMNAIWEVKPPPRNPVVSFLRDRMIPFGMVVAAAVLVVASFVLGAALSVLRRDLEAALRIEAQQLNIDMPDVSLGMGDLVSHSPLLSARLEPILATARSLQMVDLLLSIAFASLLFGLVFKFVPDTPVSWRDVWLGALLTGVMFAFGKLAIQVYLYNARIVTAYGAAGSLVVIMLWVNYSAQILFLGAEFTKVYARRYGSRARPGGTGKAAPAAR